MQKISYPNEIGIASWLQGVFIYLVCLFMPGAATAQGVYFCWTVGAGMLLNPGSSQQLQVTVPYTVIDATGHTTQNVFTSRAITPYKAEMTWSPFNWELGNRHEFLVFRLYGSTDMAHFSLGYGRNYFFDLPWVRKRDRRERSFVLKPSLNISYGFFDNRSIGETDYLGSIDNKDKEISLLNMASGPTYSVSSGSDFSSNDNSTDSTTSLDLYYEHHECVIVPRITLSNNPYKHLLHWEASIAYNEPFYSWVGIVAQQNDLNRLNNPGNLKHLDSYGTVTTFGGNKISAAPFTYSGFSIEITLGISFSKLLAGRWRRDAS